jgi:predicted  nucleic acid-binding Zn-ribbon protein
MEVKLKQYADEAEADAIQTSKEYTDGEIDKVEETLGKMQAEIDTLATADALSALDERVTTAEGEIDDLQELTEQHTTLIGELRTELGKAEDLSSETATTVVAAVNENAANIATNATNIANNVSDIALLYDALQWHQIGE